MFQTQKMYVINVTNDYIDFNNCTNIENEDININFKYSLLSIPSSILLLCLMSNNIHDD